jgi:CHAD domain-containing protein
VRALLPQLRVSGRRSNGVLRDAAGKVVVTAELHEGVHVVDRSDVDCPATTLEIHEVPGYAKQTDRTLEALRAVGVEESAADTLTLCAAAAGVDLAGFTATATVPLEPAMAAIDGFRLVLANLANTITANWQGTIDQTDPEFLHDLRIAVRRSRVVLANAKQVLPAEILDQTRDELAWLANLTSTPRDLDAYLLEWSKYTDPLGAEVAPRLEPVRDLLEQRRTDGHVALERGLRSERAATLMNSWQAWLTEPSAGDALPARARRPLGPLVAKRITRAHDRLLERGRLIGPDTPAAQVHDLRKDAKKLRYLLECFGSLLPKGARKKYVKRLKALQDNLGEHQDAEVHVHMLRAVATELHETGASADTMVAIGQLTERLDQQRLAARIEFAERFADYDNPATQRALDAMLDGISK